LSSGKSSLTGAGRPAAFLAGIAFPAAASLAAVSFQLWSPDPDVFWHLKVGEWVLEHGAVPRADVYSWTAQGQPWTAHQWLWEALMAALYGRCGLYGLWALVFVSALACALFLRAGLLSRGVSLPAAAFSGGLAPLALTGWLKPWPQAGVYALFSAYLFLSLRGKWDREGVLGAFFLAVLWSNVHSSACMLPALLLAERVGQRLLGEREDDGLFAACGAAFLGTLANPHGPGLWAYAVREGLLTGEYRQTISEWMPYWFGDVFHAALFFLCAAALFRAACLGKTRSVPFWRAAGFWALALVSRIYTPYALLSTAVVAAPLAGEKLTAGYVNRCCAVLALLAALSGPCLVKAPPADLDEQAADKYPVKAVAVLDGSGIERVYNFYGWGGYLLFKDVPVFIDGRADLYRNGLFKEYISATRGETDPVTLAESYGADGALALAGSLEDYAFRGAPGWEEVYRDDVAVVYRRGGP